MSRHRLSVLLPLAIVVVCSICSRAAEVSSPQFRSATQTVPIYVTAVRNDGHLAAGLTRSDFVVYEDGKEKAIETFSSSTDSIALIAMFQTGYLRGRDMTTDDPQARRRPQGGRW